MLDCRARGFAYRRGKCIFLVARSGRMRGHHFPAAVALDHGERAAGEIAEAVGEIAVVAREQGVVAEIAVLAKRNFAQ